MVQLRGTWIGLAVASLALIACGSEQNQVTGPATGGAKVEAAAPAAGKVASAGTWAAGGPGAVTLVSDGTTGDPEMTYAQTGYGSTFSTQTWEFRTVAAQTGAVTLPYHYSGYHAYFQVRLFLTAFVDGDAVNLVSAGPANCCSSPSGGFDLTGSHTFNVTAGQTYGFRFGGSNYDSDSRLLGTFVIPGYAPPPPPPDVTPPVITLNGPADLTIECHDGTYVEAGASAVDDRDGALAVVVSGSVDTQAAGDYTVSYTARDAAGNTAAATRTVHVVDTTPPTIALNGSASLTLECHVDAYAEAGASAADRCDGPVAVSIQGSVNALSEGDYTVTYTARDAAGNVATAQRTVRVVDTRPPQLTVVMNTTSLWPPNHAMVEVGEAVARDLCDPAVALAVTVTSNEPVNGTGDGDAAPDWAVVDHGDGTASVAVRAERKGNGTGRVYTISVKATDAAGNQSVRTSTVTVAQSQAKRK
jgi:hypothetical protein